LADFDTVVQQKSIYHCICVATPTIMLTNSLTVFDLVQFIHFKH